MPKLRWTATQDSIDLEVVNHNVYSYYVDQLNRSSMNQYAVVDLGFTALSQELQQCFGILQQVFRDRLKTSAFDFDLDPSNQHDLNHLHKQWVKVHQGNPNIATLCQALIPGVLPRVNKLIHAIEELTNRFELQSNNTGWNVPNPFGVSVLSTGTFNVSIAYHNLGRTTWQKWLNGDNDNDTDTNNFRELYSTLSISVLPPSVNTPTEQYVKWCNEQNISCAGSIMPLANFDNAGQNLLKYKQMFYKNMIIENNFIILE